MGLGSKAAQCPRELTQVGTRFKPIFGCQFHSTPHDRMTRVMCRHKLFQPVPTRDAVGVGEHNQFPTSVVYSTISRGVGKQPSRALLKSDLGELGGDNGASSFFWGTIDEDNFKVHVRLIMECSQASFEGFERVVGWDRDRYPGGTHDESLVERTAMSSHWLTFSRV